MPKASRGRKPAANPKKKARRQGFRQVAVAAPRPGSPGPETAAFRVPAAAPPAATSAAWSRRSVASGAARRRFTDSIADYWYVAGDLRRIGLLAGSLVVLLVGLSFVIR